MDIVVEADVHIEAAAAVVAGNHSLVAVAVGRTRRRMGFVPQPVVVHPSVLELRNYYNLHLSFHKEQVNCWSWEEEGELHMMTTAVVVAVGSHMVSGLVEKTMVQQKTTTTRMDWCLAHVRIGWVLMIGSDQEREENVSYYTHITERNWFYLNEEQCRHWEFNDLRGGGGAAGGAERPD